MRKELLTVISEAQLKRLDEISIQFQGNMAITQAEMQKTLGLSAEQTEKVAELQKRQQEANRALFQKVQDQEITREDMQASMTKNTDIMKTELGKILTADQAAKLKALQGKPFTKEDEGN
jgi:DNA-directed RNA polymerase subunit H (RpoH/RPB5)